MPTLTRRAVFLIACALVLALGVSTPGATDNPHATLSSDGTDPGADALASVGVVVGESGYEGTGEMSDAEADIKVSPETAEDVWRLWSLTPMDNGIAPHAIIGADERRRAKLTTSYPARAVVLITFRGARCTGWLFAADAVATAGHCVHEGPGGTWSQNVRVYPGRNGSASPYGSCSARRLYTTVGWGVLGDERYDYGVIRLNCTIGNTTGWLGYWTGSNQVLAGIPTLINGYPGDKPMTQWRSTKTPGVRAVQTHQVFYLNDTFFGDSGAPVYNTVAPRSRCRGPCVMAIHTIGPHGPYPYNAYNRGVRITADVAANLAAWRRAP